MAGEVTMIERVPVELNLGQPEQLIGFADLSKDIDSGEVTITITMGLHAGMTLEELVKMMEVKAIGFAGVMRRPADGG